MSRKLCITVVEDNESLCEVTVELLRQQGHRAVGVTSAEALSDERAGGQIDVLLVDLNLPGEDGFSLIRRYRAAYTDLTVIVVSSRDSVEDRLSSYRVGANAFIAKPTHPDELLAVIEAQARRPPDLRDPSLTQPESARRAIQLDMRRLMLIGPLGETAVSGGTADILSALALAPGQRLKYWQLIEALQENPSTYTAGALAVRIVRLRQALKKIGLEGEVIRSMRSEGYQLCVPTVIA